MEGKGFHARFLYHTVIDLCFEFVTGNFLNFTAQCLTRDTVALFMRALCVSFSYIINKSIGRFLHFKFCAPCFFFLSCKTAILHTLTYTGLHPLWIPLITTLLLPIMTSKVRSTKPRTKVRMIAKCLVKLLDYYFSKRGPYSRMKSQWN